MQTLSNPTTPQPYARRAATILVVDDDRDTREAIRDLLDMEGYKVICLASGERALAYLREHPTPDLIMSDLFMPGLNGWELVHELASKPRYTLVPIVVVTGSSSHEGAPVPADRVFNKPVDPDLLLQTVRAALRESSWLMTGKASPEAA